jgi:hypothetical protein
MAVSHFFGVVKHAANGALVERQVKHKCFLQVSWLNHYWTIIVQIINLSIRKLLFIELVKSILNIFKFQWNCTLRCFLEWPMPTSKDLNTHFDSFDRVSGVSSSVFEITHHLLWFGHIFKHRFDLGDNVVSAFNLQFSDHWLFSFVTDRSLVQ